MWDGYTPFGWGQGGTIDTPNYAGYTIEKGTSSLFGSNGVDRITTINPSHYYNYYSPHPYAFP